MTTGDAMDSPPDFEGKERRASARADTKRPTFFNLAAGDGIHQGTVIDVSPTGMCIRTHTPAPKGSEIEIEVRPKDSRDEEGSTYARGIVRWTKRLPDGASAMGVRLRRGRPGGGAPPRGPNLETRWLRRPPRGGGIDALDGSGVEVRFSRAARAANRKNRRNWLPILLLLFVLAGVLIWSLYGEITEMAARNATAREEEAETVEPEPAATAATAAAAAAEETAEVTPESPYGPLDAAYENLIAGRPAVARAAFHKIATDPAENPAQRFTALIGEAESLAAAGERNDALSTIDDALRATEGVAEPWKDLAHALRLDILAGERIGGPALFARVLEYGPVSRAGPAASAEATESPPPPRDQSLPPPPPPAYGGIHLRVSTARNLLTVLEGDRTLGTFPVGLGRNDSTPHGDFAVVNKILEPDWYDGARVVRAGDPENPLGDRWVGLGEDGQPTPYGIHGTNDTASVGLNLSRGCIRMRPADARNVFEWVDIGTPVKIVP